MKKVALSFLALLAAGSMAFAVDANSPVKVSVSASGGAKVGYSLEDSTYGLSNSASASIDVSLVGDVNSDGNVTVAKTDKPGQISASFRVGISGGAVENNASLDYAKLVFGDLYIKLAGATNPAVNYEGDITLYDGSGFSGKYGAVAESIKVAGAVAEMSAQASVSGLEIGYKVPSVLELTIGLGTMGDWTVATAAQTFEYSVAANVIAVPDATFGFAYIGGTATGATSGVGVKAGYDAKIVNVQAQVDYNLTTSTYGVVADVKLPLIPGFSIESATGYATSLAQAVKVVIGKELLSVGSLDIGYQLDTNKTYVAFATSGLDGIDAYAKATLLNNFANYYVKAGASFSKIIDGVSITADYASSDLSAGKLGLITVGASISL